MKTMLKLTLMIALLGSAVMAGDMGSGGYQPCTINCPPPPECTENCSGLALSSDDATTIDSATVYTSTDIAIDVVKGTFDLLFYGQ